MSSHRVVRRVVEEPTLPEHRRPEGILLGPLRIAISKTVPLSITGREACPHQILKLDFGELRWAARHLVLMAIVKHINHTGDFTLEELLAMEKLCIFAEKQTAPRGALPEPDANNSYDMAGGHVQFHIDSNAHEDLESVAEVDKECEDDSEIDTVSQSDFVSEASSEAVLVSPSELVSHASSEADTLVVSPHDSETVFGSEADAVLLSDSEFEIESDGGTAVPSDCRSEAGSDGGAMVTPDSESTTESNAATEAASDDGNSNEAEPSTSTQSWHRLMSLGDAVSDLDGTVEEAESQKFLLYNIPRAAIAEAYRSSDAESESLTVRDLILGKWRRKNLVRERRSFAKVFHYYYRY